MFQYKHLSDKSDKPRTRRQSGQKNSLSDTGQQSVIQRRIIVANWDLEDKGADYIYHMCMKEGLRNIASKKFGLDQSTDFIDAINKMLQAENDYRASSYKGLSHMICSVIAESLPPRRAGNVEAPYSLLPFSADALKRNYPPMDPGSLYRPLSPIAAGDEDLRRLRTEKSVDFHMGDRDYHVGGNGRFLSGVGTYRELLSDENIVGEMQGLFSGRISVSNFAAANNLHTLIVGVEGCARSVHNIALAKIFFDNYNAIKQNNPNQSLFELANTFLTFVRAGGASLSARYAENADELKMLIAHCEANGVPITVEGISEYLISVSRQVIDNAGIRIL